MIHFGSRLAAALGPEPQETKAVTVRITSQRVLRVSRAANEVLLAICYDGENALTRGLRAVHVPMAKLEEVRAALRTVARDTAKKNGVPKRQRIAAQRFFTGKPCPRGHVAARLASTNTCVICAREKARAWRAKRRAASRQSPPKRRRK